MAFQFPRNEKRIKVAGDPYYWWEHQQYPVYTPVRTPEYSTTYTSPLSGWWCEKCEVTNAPHVNQCPSCWEKHAKKSNSRD